MLSAPEPSPSRVKKESSFFVCYSQLESTASLVLNLRLVEAKEEKRRRRLMSAWERRQLEVIPYDCTSEFVFEFAFKSLFPQYFGLVDGMLATSISTFQEPMTHTPENYDHVTVFHLWCRGERLQ